MEKTPEEVIKEVLVNIAEYNAMYDKILTDEEYPIDYIRKLNRIRYMFNNMQLYLYEFIL